MLGDIEEKGPALPVTDSLAERWRMDSFRFLLVASIVTLVTGQPDVHAGISALTPPGYWSDQSVELGLSAEGVASGVFPISISRTELEALTSDPIEFLRCQGLLPNILRCRDLPVFLLASSRNKEEMRARGL